MSYTKLANSILTSTIWMEDDPTRIVWLTLLAMADKNGEVQASVPGLANVARVPVESCRAAIVKFLSPDPDSRTKVDEGRRIEEIKGGWILINHSEYRELASDDDRKAKAAIRQQRFRDRRARNAEVTLKSRQNPQADTDTEADTEALQIKNQVQEQRKTIRQPVENLKLMRKIAHDIIDQGVPPEDRKDALKDECARLGVKYDADSIRTTLDGVEHQRDQA